MGHLFIVQANGPDSRICGIRSGSEIGWRATQAYLGRPDRKMIGSTSMSHDYEGVEDILKVAHSEDKPGLGLLVCVKGSGGETDWITRTTLRNIWGMGDADAEIYKIFKKEGKIPPGRAARLEYKPRKAPDYKPRRQRYDVSSDETIDDESDSEAEVARSRSGSRPAAEASNSQTRHRRHGQRAELKNSAAEDEDPEIANLRLHLAKMGQKMDNTNAARTQTLSSTRYRNVSTAEIERQIKLLQLTEELERRRNA
ncbi:hypothetical protein AJ78_07995 [Emergomyces pasteurianus Ep9510]|uniref:Uncharacterized protein n=1 Tax=Emergomyces pasteurianus Ep9510 TaxID=1447872 RepID=A0A1J9Q7N8_9EURO|nr:hypothetical protein AJ78_07995 [Emergomyces pasteurianus Ep9510]